MSLRPPKKSETLEVRIPHEVKNALMQKARAEGRSASDVVRSFVDSYLAGDKTEAQSMIFTLWKPAAAIGAATIAVMWAALAPAPTQATPDLKSVFQMLDRNHDGVITLDEFVRDAADPAIEKMHHAHMMKGAGSKSAKAAHASMMQTAHGKASAEQIRAHFAQMDANSDGKITFDEFKSFHDRMKNSHAAH